MKRSPRILFRPSKSLPDLNDHEGGGPTPTLTHAKTLPGAPRREAKGLNRGKVRAAEALRIQPQDEQGAAGALTPKTPIGMWAEAAGDGERAGDGSAGWKQKTSQGGVTADLP